MSDSSVLISEDLYSRLRDRVEATNYESVDEYCGFVLSEVIHQLDEPESSVNGDEVEDRLKALGYVE